MSKLLKGAAAAALSLGLAAFAVSAQAAPPPPSNDLTVQKSCTASDVTFESRAEWKYTYVAGGVTKAAIDRLEWSIQDQGDSDPILPGVQAYAQGVDPQYGADDTTDYTLKVYDGDARVQTLAGDDVEVNYANDGDNGELWKGRNPKNPVVKAGSRITLVVGVDGDGKPGCKVTFRVPAELGPKLAE